MSEQELEPIEWNAENVLDALNDFERKPDLNPVLNSYLLRIAQNGEIVFPWSKLKPLLKKKMEVVLDDFSENYPIEPNVSVPNFEAFNYEALKKTILHAVESFASAPFTIQRICELITNPTKHYSRTDKYMRGIEKNVLVVSTIEHRIGFGDGNANPIVNGMLNDSMRDENDTINGHEIADGVSSSNLNSPSNHVLLENFANVFPSAACIPSASCINREVDSNFVTAVECVQCLKEEAMDTSEDEQSSSEASSDDSSNEVSSGGATPSPDPKEENPKNLDAKEEKFESAESSDATIEQSVEQVESIGKAEEDSKNEADCSEPCPDIPLVEQESVKAVVTNAPFECPQDDTISQSDDDSIAAPELPASDDSSEVEVVPQLQKSEEENSPVETAGNVTTSELSDSAEQNMEQQTSTNNIEEPPA